MFTKGRAMTPEGQEEIKTSRSGYHIAQNIQASKIIEYAIIMALDGTGYQGRWRRDPCFAVFWL